MLKRIFNSINIPIYNRFIATEGQVDKIIRNLKNKNINPIVDYAIEKAGANSALVVDKVKNQVIKYPNDITALKLSVLDLKNMDNCFNNCTLIHKASPNTKLLVDAEQDSLQPIINEISDNLIIQHNIEKPIFFKTYQMYRTDSLDKLKFDLYFFNKIGVYHGIKLVRGAYYQEDFKKGVLHSNKSETDNDYNKAISLIVDSAYKNQNINAIIATHNKQSVDFFLSKMENIKDDNFYKNFNTATLMGFEPKYPIYPETNIQHLMYLPYGPIMDTLPYLSRRLIENWEMIKNL